jgi:hypothetical protein
MILGHVSYLDCIVFLVLLAPQLIINVGFVDTFVCAIRALPFLCMPRTTSPYTIPHYEDIY